MRGILVASILAAAASSASAANVFVLSSGNAPLDALFQSKLQAAGHTTTLGPQFSEYAGSSLEAYDAVLLLANYNWNRPAMPVQGQANIYNFVLAGGGLITTEWILWSNGSGNGPWAPLEPTFASASTGGTFRTSAQATYAARTTDPILTAGLPASFTFAPDNFAGTESRLLPKPGASILFASDYPHTQEVGGVVGWGFGNGRVVNFSTCVGTGQLNDTNFARLLANVVLWSASNPGCRADFDNGTGTGTRDGAVSIEDLVYYMFLFEMGIVEADVDDGSGTGVGDAAVDISDLLYYLVRFEAGC
jgi:hypothetical protein